MRRRRGPNVCVNCQLCERSHTVHWPPPWHTCWRPQKSTHWDRGAQVQPVNGDAPEGEGLRKGMYREVQLPDKRSAFRAERTKKKNLPGTLALSAHGPNMGTWLSTNGPKGTRDRRQQYPGNLGRAEMWAERVQLRELKRDLSCALPISFRRSRHMSGGRAPTRG